MDKKKVVFQILDSYAEITITDQQDNIVFLEIGGKEYGCWYPEIDQDTSSPFIFVKNDTEYDYPHILPTSIPMDKNFANKYRYVCLDENDSTIPFLQSFEEKIRDIIEKLIHLLSLSDNVIDNPSPSAFVYPKYLSVCFHTFLLLLIKMNLLLKVE